MTSFSHASSSPALARCTNKESVLYSIREFASLYFLNNITILLLKKLGFFCFYLYFSKKAHGFIKSIRLIYILLLFFPNPFNNAFPTHLFKLILWYHIRNPNQNWNHKHTWHYRKMQPEEKCCTERIY